MVKIVYRTQDGLVQRPGEGVDLSGATFTFTETVRAPTADYNVVVRDDFILADASSGQLTVTLPAATVDGMMCTIKKTDATGFSVIVATADDATIDGETTARIDTQYTSLTIVAYSGDWYIK